MWVQYPPMPVDYTHESFDDRSPDWCRARDFIAGERRVKEKGAEYLQELQDQTDDEYRGYKSRTKFLNATARTHEGLMGMVFLKDPVTVLPASLEDFEQDTNLSGDGLYAYTRQIVSEVLAVGRGGTFIDWSVESDRPYFAYYAAEAIRNWRYEMVGGKRLLTLLVLAETTTAIDNRVAEKGAESNKDIPDPYKPVEIEQLRVLRLIALPDGKAMVRVEIWIKDDTDVKTDPKVGREKWILESTAELSRKGKVLSEIPFVFHGPDLIDACVPKPPLDDLVSLNLTHYRLSADHYHGLHFVALPTPWVAGFEAKTALRIGSSVAWVSENPDASAGFLEFSGQGLGAIREELDRIEHSMAVLGARLLETQKRAVETAEAMSIRQSGESAVLTRIASACSQSLREALKWAHWWLTPGLEDRSEITDKQMSVELNSDFSTARMTGAELVSFVSSWIQKGISFDTLFWNLKQGDLIPPDRTKEQERELIEAEAPVLDLGKETQQV